MNVRAYSSTAAPSKARTGRHGRRAVLVLGPVLALSAALLVAINPATASAAAPPGVSPVLERTPSMVTADALPTVQINGVVWSETVVGNTVYAGGNFANARPAGAAAGTQLTPRTDLLSFDITTGLLNTSFDPTLNGQVKFVTHSPDGSRIYIGGDFTSVNGVARYRIAAFSTATGALITSFAPSFNTSVNSISVTNTAVYVGGIFTQANGVARSRLAAFDPNTGALLAWNPSADGIVQAVLATPDGSRVVVGGAFLNLNGVPANGLGAVSASTGATQPFLANTVLAQGGSSASVMSLTTDGTAIYSSAYSLGSGNYEGILSANQDTGAINWLADCHGDSYDTFPTATAIYVVSHEHTCENIGGFPDTNPRTVWHRSTAFTINATGTVKPNDEFCCSYGNFPGQPSPSEYQWMPDMDIGTFTGQNQGPWSVNGNASYVVEGGEFLHVNGVAQQGLVRFAIPALAPNRVGPVNSGSAVGLTASAASSTSVRLTWASNWDRDDENLTYSVYRQDQATPLYQTTVPSLYWINQTLPFTDTTARPGTTYTYRVTVADPSGNTVSSNSVTVTTPAGSGPVAAFTAATNQLAVSFDGSGSSDAGGTITGYAWTFGDGAGGSGVRPSHTYGSAGSYPVTLTVTDNRGLTSSVSHTVAVTSAGSVLASDSFSRSLASGWGNADIGGSWSLIGPSQFSVNGSQGQISLTASGSYPTAGLSVATTTTNLLADVGLSQAATGNGVTVLLYARSAGSSQYRLKVIFLPGGVVHLAWSKVVSGHETTVNEVVVSGLTYTPGQLLRVRLRLTGTNPTTIAGTIWPAGGTEPASPQLTATDSEPSLQTAGSIGLQAAIGSTANPPEVVSVDNVTLSSS